MGRNLSKNDTRKRAMRSDCGVPRLDRRASIADRIERLSIPEPNSGCLLWLGAVAKGNKKRDGYGIITVGMRSERGKNRVTMSHRASYEAANGPIPDGLSVCHRCDNSLCVNPEHLFLGTHQDNMGDMVRKGRAGRRLRR